MCGIAGVVGLGSNGDQGQAIVDGMIARIRHRGPDGGGVISHPDATLGMARLAIVDVSNGHQPMSNEDGSVVLVYNGEVYNAPALRQQLQRAGVAFRTRSDTEVILRLYEQDPNRVEEHLAGMWAFAVHDRRRRRVVLSRDRFGIKPLFIADTGGALAFASELGSFDRSLQPFAPLFAVDHDAAHAMLSWSYVPHSRTIFKGVERLDPATRLTIDLTTGARQRRTHWSLRPSEEAARIRSLDEACEHVDALLRRSVKEHLESDVPLATFLSGGIDSSLVTAYAREESGTTIKAYSIGFQEPEFDESEFARATAERIGVPISVATFDEAQARARMVDALLAYDEPLGDPSTLATYLLCRHVGKDFKVALGGDGGDEVFAGYKRYTLVQLRQLFANQSRLRNWVGRTLKRTPLDYEGTARYAYLFKKAHFVASGLDGTPAHAYMRLAQWAPLSVTASLVRQPMSTLAFEEVARSLYDRSEGTELQRLLASDLADSLGNDMLVKVDRASMRNALEARVPMLDHRLVEFGVGLPEEFTSGPRLRGFVGKRVLRALHERRFGPELARRKKRGFSVPVKHWLRGPFDGACARLFDRARLDRFGILSSDTLSDGRFRQWLHGPAPEIVWHAFALASWCEATLGDGPEALRELIEDPGPRQSRVFLTSQPQDAAVSPSGV